MLLDARRPAVGTLTAALVAGPALVDRRRAGAAIVLTPLGAAILARAVRRLGGATGEVFGATIELSLVALLVALS